MKSNALRLSFEKWLENTGRSGSCLDQPDLFEFFDFVEKEYPDTILKRETVCSSCLSIGMTDPDCVCCHSNRYETVSLDFELCSYCSHPLHDGNPADTQHNNDYFK